jgi:hypothetical protein
MPPRGGARNNYEFGYQAKSENPMFNAPGGGNILLAPLRNSAAAAAAAPA